MREQIMKYAEKINRQVVIHKRDDMNSIDPTKQVFGDAGKEGDPVRIVHDSTTGSFMLLFFKDCKVDMRGIDKESFRKSFPTLFDSLDEWMQVFFDLRTLFAYIYDGEKNTYVKKSLEQLRDLTLDFRRVV